MRRSVVGYDHVENKRRSRLHDFRGQRGRRNAAVPHLDFGKQRTDGTSVRIVCRSIDSAEAGVVVGVALLICRSVTTAVARRLGRRITARIVARRQRVQAMPGHGDQAVAEC